MGGVLARLDIALYVNLKQKKLTSVMKKKPGEVGVGAKINTRMAVALHEGIIGGRRVFPRCVEICNFADIVGQGL